MSTQEHASREESLRSPESIVAEAIICKMFGWKVGFLSGGVGVLTKEQLVQLLRLIHQITGKKIWLNTGILPKKTLEACVPYIRGVIGTVEVIDPKLHDEICPSKPLAPIEKMFEYAEELQLERAMTFIVGLGETIDDFFLLEAFIKKHGLTKIHIYGLIPQKGTFFENTQPPSPEYQAEWIARTRIAFPDINILCGIWKDRPEHLGLLLKAGANNLSKFPAIKAFNSPAANEVEAQIKNAGRTFIGTLTEIRTLNINDELALLDFEQRRKEKTRRKFFQYLSLIEKRIRSTSHASPC